MFVVLPVWVKPQLLTTLTLITVNMLEDKGCETLPRSQQHPWLRLSMIRIHKLGTLLLQQDLFITLYNHARYSKAGQPDAHRIH
jgi:hypothetical protein